MQSRLPSSITATPSNTTRPRHRPLVRMLGVCCLFSLLAACSDDSGSNPSGRGFDDAPSPDLNQAEPSHASDEAAQNDDTADAGQLNGSSEPVVAEQPPIVARTRSTRQGLDEASKRNLVEQIGAIEHTFSNGDKTVYVTSEHGNFGIGDVILGETKDMAEYIAEQESFRVLGIGLNTNQTSNLWPNRTVRFRIDPNISGANLTTLNAAIDSWNADSPVVRWVATTSTSGAYVRFIRSTSTAFCGRSRVGRGGGRQDLEIVCFNNGTILHEMGHATGLEHEHQRCGRGGFVNVQNDAMGNRPDDVNYGERCGSTRRNYGDYDYGSIMHYGPTAFLSVVAAPTGPFLGLPGSIGQRIRLSQNDVNSINQMYTNRTTPTTWGSGFAWSSQLTGAVDANPHYSANSAKVGGAPFANISQLGTGRYLVKFPGLGSEVGGNVQVTAYGADTNRCKVERWISNGNDLDVTVRCNTPAGALVDSLFVASYQRSPSSAGFNGGYLNSNRFREVGAYTPDPWYQWNSSGQSSRVTALGTGSYQVDFPGANVNGGTVRVTAFGANSDYCTIGSWGTDVVFVNCWDTNGNPKDSAFSLYFTENAFPGTYAYAWANEPTSASYEPASSYQRTVIAGEVGGIQPTPIRIDRAGVGDYNVIITDVPDQETTANVAAYSSNSACKINFWVPTSPSPTGLRRQQVNVRCFAPNGTPADSMFTISYFSTERTIG